MKISNCIKKIKIYKRKQNRNMGLYEYIFSDDLSQIIVNTTFYLATFHLIYILTNNTLTIYFSNNFFYNTSISLLISLCLYFFVISIFYVISWGYMRVIKSIVSIIYLSFLYFYFVISNNNSNMEYSDLVMWKAFLNNPLLYIMLILYYLIARLRQFSFDSMLDFKNSYLLKSFFTNLVLIFFLFFVSVLAQADSSILYVSFFLLIGFLIEFFILIIGTPFKLQYSRGTYMINSDSYIFVTDATNAKKLVILPFYSQSQEFVPIEITSNKYIYNVINVDGTYSCSDNKPTYIIPVTTDNLYPIYCTRTCLNKNKVSYHKILVYLEKKEGSYFVSSVRSIPLTSMYKFLLKKKCISLIPWHKFMWYKKTIVRNFDDKQVIKLLDRVKEIAVYNEHFGMHEKFVHNLKDSEYIASYMDLSFGSGKTTYANMLNEKYGYNPIFITPQEITNININYNIFFECYKRSFKLPILSIFWKSIYYYAYTFGFTIIIFSLIKTTGFENITIENFGNLNTYVLSFLLTPILTSFIFPYLIAFKGHRDSGLNQLYIQAIAKMLQQNHTTVIIENFDRFEYHNFENLFILLDGLRLTKLSLSDNIYFIINAKLENIDSPHTESFVYQIQKHCSIGVFKSISAKRYLNSLEENFPELSKYSIEDPEKQKLIFDFRDCTKLKGIIKERYKVTEIKYDFNSKLFLLSSVFVILCFSTHLILSNVILSLTINFIFIIYIIIKIFVPDNSFVNYSINFTVITLLCFFLLDILHDTVNNLEILNFILIEYAEIIFKCLFILVLNMIVFTIFSSIFLSQNQKLSDDEISHKLASFWEEKKNRNDILNKSQDV